MRAIVPLLVVLAVLSAGGAAWAAISASGAPVPDRRPTRAPAASTAKPAVAKAPKAAPVLAAIRPKASPMPPDINQCRLDCSRSYYFCLSTDDADSCGPVWASCRSACASPPTTAAPASALGTPTP